VRIKSSGTVGIIKVLINGFANPVFVRSVHDGQRGRFGPWCNECALWRRSERLWSSRFPPAGNEDFKHLGLGDEMTPRTGHGDVEEPYFGFGARVHGVQARA